ncbi:galectin-related protein A-like [Ictalurus punctatus]|uniref:Galectin n=1 Tax=Ictalurus punctatus TaxID=7998 RepID=W5UBA2_ICTPU|nr:galectin-related protein A-like [Ictalurus punctatus]ALM30378.1 GRPc [Ictalurus punctatus]
MSDSTPRSEKDYVGQIKGGMRPAMRIIVMGIIHKQPRSMLVTVSCPPREGDEEQEGDVGLQLTIKFPERAVIRNYRLNGKWGTEESNLSFFPFAAGESFKMEIVCEHQQFRILVDGQPLCGFTHRVTQLASLTSLRVGGDLQLTKVA